METFILCEPYRKNSEHGRGGAGGNSCEKEALSQIPRIWGKKVMWVYVKKRSVLENWECG